MRSDLPLELPSHVDGGFAASLECKDPYRIVAETIEMQEQNFFKIRRSYYKHLIIFFELWIVNEAI